MDDHARSPAVHDRTLQQRSNHQDSHTRIERHRIRTATRHDLPFIDQLQKKFSNNVGFMPAPALEGYLNRACILIAEENDRQIGYLLGRDALHWQPLLRPIYQLCIEPHAQGNSHAIALITAWQNLAKLAGQLGLQANCSADIAANTFWPRIGFHFTCALQPTNARSRHIIVWRKALASRLPRWFIDPPARAGHRAKRTGAK